MCGIFHYTSLVCCKLYYLQAILLNTLCFRKLLMESVVLLETTLVLPEVVLSGVPLPCVCFLDF